jgi:hypothetical protein
MTKLTDKQLWDALDDITAESEQESRLARTPEERREALAKEGYDLQALDAEADAFFASLDERLAAMRAKPALEATPQHAPTPEHAPALAIEPVQAQPNEPERAHGVVRPLWRRPLVAIPSALAFAAGVALVVHAFSNSPVIGPDLLSPTEAHAIALRHEARESCNASEWQKCLDDLDQARALDPAGDAQQYTKELRATAEEGIRDTPPVPSTPPHRPGPDDFRKVPK